ncbi:MAG: tRNA lysidine(34) synthetase TilS [Ferruginibacter sp.]
MDLLTAFTAYIKANHLFEKKDKLLLALSGGRDSAVLFELCLRSGFDLSAAHCNFQLRGEESERDETFVKELAGKNNVPLFIKKFDTAYAAKENKTSIEETARNLRYAWFDEIITQSGSGGQLPFTRLLTAHHADDNAETVLMNFLRGTGIRGLRGIRPMHGKIIRPLLFATGNEINAFAAENNTRFVTDSSNALNDHTRNFFRNELIPGIEKVLPEVKQNIIRNIERFGEMEYLYDQSITALKNKLVEKKGAELHIPVLKLAGIVPLRTVLFEIIKDYGFTALQVHEAEKLLHSQSGKYILSASHRILRNRNWLIISSRDQADSNTYFLIEANDTTVLFPGGELTVKPVSNPAEINPDKHIACIDAGMIKYPLLLRKWKQGDYFYPLGSKGKKKLSRFFGDLKLSLIQKENVWVLESDKKIIWVVGHRIDERFKIREVTLNSVKLSLFPAGQTSLGS